jgi:uncharacterized protein (TIGR03790 family)
MFSKCVVLAVLIVLAACGGGGGGASGGTPVVTPPVVVPPTPAPGLTLTLPASGLNASQLGVLVAQGDPESESIASYYAAARGIPAANVIRVAVPSGSDSMTAAAFATLKADIDAKLPADVQATLVTWTAPSRVMGACSMGLTSALALGYDAQYCGGGCSATKASPYFDSESVKPWTDHGIRPSMMLGVKTLAAAQALIDRGVQADNTQPAGDGYLLRTSDTARNVRYPDYTALPALWSGNTGLQLNYLDNSGGTGANSISNKSNVLFYFTGLTTVPNISTNTYRPGAVADHLTSFGGFLPGGNGQMPITQWLDAGATASYGTVEEPCNYTAKFSQASVLIDQYYRGATVLEAYWKSVQWPGQGLFIGEPLARPFANTPALAISNGQYSISTRALRANANYSLDYKNTAGNWVTLATFRVSRAQPQSLTAPIAPSTATQLRWTGPCPTASSLQCTLATSG